MQLGLAVSIHWPTSTYNIQVTSSRRAHHLHAADYHHHDARKSLPRHIDATPAVRHEAVNYWHAAIAEPRPSDARHGALPSARR